MKKILSVVLSALLLIGCVAISATANTNIYTVDDVAVIANYVAGYWSATTGEFSEHTHRIATNGYVAVDASKTYTIASAAKSHGNTSFYLAEFDADKNFVAGIGRTELGKAGTYSYKVTFKNYDGAILHSEHFAKGVVPAYDGILPKKPASKT